MLEIKVNNFTNIPKIMVIGIGGGGNNAGGYGFINGSTNSLCPGCILKEERDFYCVILMQ